MIKDMEVECKTKFSMDVEFSFSFKPLRTNVYLCIDNEHVFCYTILIEANKCLIG